LLITLSFGNLRAISNLEKSSVCYGIIVPLPSGEDTTMETFENSRVRNMINDILRLNITVYWSNENFTASSKKLDSNDTIKLEYKKGTFIIPFSGDVFKDLLTISIISDYNQTHELDNQSLFNNEIYLLAEEIRTNCNQLIEPKIVQHFEKPVRYGWPSYLLMAEAGGFFNYDFLIEGETKKFLNNENFNLLIWPYLPSSANYFEAYITFMDIKNINAIRKFVCNGGGFIGTCYGAYAASSGFIKPGIFFSLLHAYNPNLNRILPPFSISISDSVMKIDLQGFTKLYITKHKVVNINHPIFYGVNETFSDFFKGPIFTWFGKNTSPLTIYYDIKPFNNNTVSNKLKKSIIGRTSWVNSTFGKGKIILYASHPDYINNITPLFKENNWDGDEYYGRRIIHNSIFFVTSNDTPVIDYKSYNSSFVYNIIKNTNNLSINNFTADEFEDLNKKIIELFDNVYSFRNTTVDLKDLLLQFTNKSKSFSDNLKIANYLFWLSEIYMDYLNKTKSSIGLLEKVLPMLYEYNTSILSTVKKLNNELYDLLNKSEKIVDQTKETVNLVKENLNYSRISFFKTVKIRVQEKFILQNFEICLKYIPKVYFEILKLLRNSWYTYEAYIAMDIYNDIYK